MSDRTITIKKIYTYNQKQQQQQQQQRKSE